MTRTARLTRVCAVALCLVLACATLPAAGATQDGSAAATPTVTVENATVDAGNGTTVALTLSSAPDGLAGYALNVSVDSDVATVTNATVGDAFGFGNASIDGGSVTLAGADTMGAIDQGATNVTLGTLRLKGAAAGDSALSVSLTQVDSDDGSALGPAVTNGTLTVTPAEDTPSVPTVETTDANVSVGASGTATVTLSHAPDGLAGYAVDVSVADDSVGSVTDASVPGSFGFGNASADDGTATLAGADTAGIITAGATNVTLGSVTVQGATPGETTLRVTVTQVDAEDGAGVDPRAAGGTFTVVAGSDQRPTIPGGQGPARNVDDDPYLEDVNGDGQANVFDALAYYNNRDSAAVQNNPGAFDFDGRAPAGTLFDALALYNDIA